MEELLLISLQLTNLLLFAVVIRFELLHQLLVRLEQSRILDQVRSLVCLLILGQRVRVGGWRVRLGRRVVEVVGERGVQSDGPLQLLLQITDYTQE